jgi:hypothetical protein
MDKSIDTPNIRYDDILVIILDEYMSCLNVKFYNDRLYCDLWWKHDDCERIMNLLYKITKDQTYTRPQSAPSMSSSINQALTNPSISTTLSMLEENGI